MAIQMATALVVSFAIGYVLFPRHWAWIVLTAFIVNSGNRGRLDVAHKSVLRVLGAAGGTVLAAIVGMLPSVHGPASVVLMLAAVFFGTWLRPFSYGWWALSVTVALALLQDFAGVSPTGMLWDRLQEIVIGAIIGVAAAWFVWPIRSTATLRRRIADALATLATALDRQQPTHTPYAFFTALAAVQQLAPAFRATRHITKRVRPECPAEWIDTLLACREPAGKLIEQGSAPPSVYQSLGQARRAMREPTEILIALQQLRVSLDGAQLNGSSPKTDAST